MPGWERCWCPEVGAGGRTDPREAESLAKRFREGSSPFESIREGFGKRVMTASRARRTSSPWQPGAPTSCWSCSTRAQELKRLHRTRGGAPDPARPNPGHVLREALAAHPRHLRGRHDPARWPRHPAAPRAGGDRNPGEPPRRRPRPLALGHGIMARTFSHASVEQLAEEASIPVINGLDGPAPSLPGHGGSPDHRGEDGSARRPRWPTWATGTTSRTPSCCLRR